MTRPRRRRTRPWGRVAVVAGVLALAAPARAGALSTPTSDPGRLTVATEEPALGAPLDHQLTVLWRAIVRDDATLARTVFFPEGPYVTMKTGLIASPSADYADRLIAFYNLDLAAYHRLLLAGGTPTLVRVEASRADGAWIAPRDCENLVGYWHLPGVRFVYRRGATLFSVAVASLISWHDQWYVVHLGPNPRPSDVGTVDGYAVGPGRPGPPGGC
jgi:hypothetical protein